jgi:hypothetical protein
MREQKTVGAGAKLTALVMAAPLNCSAICVESRLSHRIVLCAFRRDLGDACSIPSPINKTLANQPFPVINERTTVPCP